MVYKEIMQGLTDTNFISLGDPLSKICLAIRSTEQKVLVLADGIVPCGIITMESLVYEYCQERSTEFKAENLLLEPFEIVDACQVLDTSHFKGKHFCLVRDDNKDFVGLVTIAQVSMALLGSLAEAMKDLENTKSFLSLPCQENDRYGGLPQGIWSETVHRKAEKTSHFSLPRIN